MLYLAIDQHRKQLTVDLRNEAGDVLVRRQVSTEWTRVREFLEEVRARGVPAGGFVAILEVCGFNDWLLKLLAEYGCRETVLVQPEKRSRKKTDRRDANALGEILWVNRRRLLAGQRVQGVRRVILPADQEAENRQLTALRRLDHQTRQCHGPLHPRTTGDPCVATGRSDEGVVRQDQETAWLEDCPGGGDAPVGDGHLAHGQAP